MQGTVLEQELSYWKESLDGAPATLNLPLDHRPGSAPGKASHRSIRFSPELSADLLAFAQRDGSTPFMLLLAALALTLNKWTGATDLVIGTVVAGRNRKEVEKVIGCFMNFLPIRVRIAVDETAAQFLVAVRKTVLESQAHQDCPFEKIVEAINPERSLNQNPLYNVALLLQNFPADVFHGEALQAARMPVSMEAALLDLRFEAEETPEGFSLLCEYRKDLFDASTIEQLLAGCVEVLEPLVGRPETVLASIAPPANLAKQAKAARADEVQQTIAISATFTAEPLETPLGYWLKQLELPAKIEFAPFNQTYQQLLDPSSLFATNERGLNVLLLILEDWLPPDVKAIPDKPAQEELERKVSEFVQALKAGSIRSSTPYLVCFCPPSSNAAANPELAAVLASQEKLLAGQLERLDSVYLLSAGELATWYPVEDYSDPHGNELAHVPYKPLFFTALATAIARKFHALKRTPFKVIALDCDNTLWSGVCGEDGASGVRIDLARQALQKFFREQHDAGLLLCLCSKNNPQDVHEVFAKRLEMPLHREHFAAERLNWQPKSQNLRSLAQELQLGLDSFIFVDDNPIECAEVEASCPEVLALQLPEEPESIPDFLKHCWAFDHLKLTNEDRQRTQMYHQQQLRQQFRSQAMSLKDFLDGLDLKVRLEPVSPDQLARASQLTLRTNQFNCTTRRRSEAELQQLLTTHADVLTASVTDRFGDYGLVGVLIYETRGRALDVDSFLLSCRVLGRGVEHRLLARLGQIAQQRHLEWVDVHFSKTEKNKPAFEFLESVGHGFKQPLNGGYLYRFPARLAAGLRFNPQQVEARPGPSKEENRVSGTRSGRMSVPPERVSSKPTPQRVEESAALPSSAMSDLAPRFRRYRQLAVEADKVLKIHRLIEAEGVVRLRRQSGYVAPRTGLERTLCQLWQKLLHLDKIGVQDNFFDLGGHSLLAVRLFAEIAELTGRKFPLVTLFQAPMVEQLARVVCRQDSEAEQSLLVPIQPEGDRPPLFLVHGAGGDVLWGYANLAAYLGKEQPIYGIKFRGQTGLEEFTNIEQMARHYLEEVRAFQPEGPYYLGGYCFGGNVAYAMARELVAQGEQVALLALLDSAPSNAGYERLTWWRAHFVCRFALNFYYWLEDFARLKPLERHRFFARKLRAFGRKVLRRVRTQTQPGLFDIEEVIDPTHVPENELKLWQIHLQALTDHVEQTYPGRLILFRTHGQPMFCSFEEDFCWSKLAKAGVSVKRIPGSHENIFMEPNVQHLARELALSLEQVRAEMAGVPADAHL
jgi:FkbH-like protein